MKGRAGVSRAAGDDARKHGAVTAHQAHTIDHDDGRRALFAADAAQADVGQVGDKLRLELMYEVWLSASSKLLFRLAVHMDRDTMRRWTDLGSRAQLTQDDVADFEIEYGLEDPLEEIETWLRPRLPQRPDSNYRRGLGMTHASGRRRASSGPVRVPIARMPLAPSGHTRSGMGVCVDTG